VMLPMSGRNSSTSISRMPAWSHWWR
jgi:hypothetical protein